MGCFGDNPGFSKKLFGLWLPERRQQGIDLSDRSGGEFRHDVFEPMPETDVIGLACGGKGIKDCQSLTTGFTSGEKTILPDDSNTAVESFSGIVVDIEAGIFQEFAKFRLNIQCI